MGSCTRRCSVPFDGQLFESLFPGSSYIDILVYNLWRLGKVEGIPSALRENFAATLGFATFLAGFQFLGLQLDNSNGKDLPESTTLLLEWSAFLLVIGLVLSSLSACLCLIVIEFLRFLQHEPPALILVAVSKYNFYVRWATKLSIISLLIFIVSVNTAAHAYEPLYFSVPVHFVSGAAVIFAIASSLMINFRRQRFRVTSDSGKNFPVQRSLYNYRRQHGQHATNPWKDDKDNANDLKGKVTVTYGHLYEIIGDFTNMFSFLRNRQRPAAASSDAC